MQQDAFRKSVWEVAGRLGASQNTLRVGRKPTPVFLWLLHRNLAWHTCPMPIKTIIKKNIKQSMN